MNTEPQRAFVQYPNHRSTTLKYDPCFNNIQEGRCAENGLDCSSCRAFLISDRFLGDDFQQYVMGGRNKFAYCLIADTWDCNFRCWFCYSHHYWSERYSKYERQLKRIYLSPDILAQQFICKIRQMRRIVSPRERQKPFTMVRISGGEPLFATQRNQIPAAKGVDYVSGIDFWISFFKHLNNGVAELAHNEDLFFATSREWKTYPSQHNFPVALQDFYVDDGTPMFTEGNRRLIVRFDTNGLLFSDFDIAGNEGKGREYTERFIGGLYNLHREGHLDAICVRLTLSFKGSTPEEFYWCESKKCETVSPEYNTRDFDPLEHPQYSSYVNLDNCIKQFTASDRSFHECVYINPERGVMHQRDNNVWVFHEGAIDWDNFSARTDIPLSPVRNDFNLITDRAITAMLWRYVGKGAALTASYREGTDIKRLTVKGADSYEQNKRSVDTFAHFYKENRRKPEFKIVIYPQ